MRSLYIGNEIKEHPQTGGEYINYRNYRLLETVFGSANVAKIELNAREITIDGQRFATGGPALGDRLGGVALVRKLCGLANVLQNYLAGLDAGKEKLIGDYLQAQPVDYVFLCASQLGRLAGYIKKRFPSVKVITFFHNIEYQFMTEQVKREGRHKTPFIWAAKYNERQAVRHSDQVITLNARDSELLLRLYGRPADLELPMSFQDAFRGQPDGAAPGGETTLQYLFVGSNFFANYEGVKWFVEQVMPKLPGELVVVGKGMETYRRELERKNVKVVGTVDDLAPYYRQADLVVSPIFSGSGMKTKTAEALMYGKTIFGTTEAFEGYDLNGAIGEVCNEADEFVEKINAWIGNNRIAKFNAASRQCFLEKYSFDGSVEKFAQALALTRERRETT